MYGRASVSQSYGNPVQLGVSLLSLWVMPAAKPPNGLLCVCRVGGSRDLRWKLELGGRDALIQLQAIVTPAQMGYAYFCVHTPAYFCVRTCTHLLISACTRARTYACVCLKWLHTMCPHANGRHTSASCGIFMYGLPNVYRQTDVHTLARTCVRAQRRLSVTPEPVMDRTLFCNLHWPHA